MKFKAYCFFLLFSISAVSQQQLIDSLERQIQVVAKKSAARVTILNDLGYYYNRIKPEKGLQYCEEAIVLAQELNLEGQLALAYKYKGMNYHTMAKDSLALLMYENAIAIQEKSKIKDKMALAKTIFNQGLVYFDQSNYVKANESNWNAYHIFEQQKDSFLMAKMLNSIGINEMYQVQYPEAIEAFLNAAIIYENIGQQDDLEFGSIQSNLGILYKRLDKFEKAIDHQTKALDIYKNADYLLGQANAYSSLGTIYDTKGDHQNAIEYYKKSNTLNKDIGNKIGEASNLTNTAIAYKSLQVYDEAIALLLQAEIRYKELGNVTNLAIVYDNMGQSYSKLFERNAEIAFIIKAKTYYEKAYEQSKSVDNVKVQQESLEGLAWANAGLNNFEVAYDQRTQSAILKDSFLSSNKIEEFAKMEARFAYEKKEALLQAVHEKEQAIAVAETEAQRLKKNGVFIGGVLLLLLSILGFILYKKRQTTLLKSKEARFNAKVSQTELKALRAQLNPHFIFNSLNSIGDYILKNEIHAATDYLSKFAKLMRQILENSKEKEILLSEDIVVLKTYLDIENKRFKDRFTYNFDIDASIDPDNTLVPPLIIQPFLENSIKHGLTTLKAKGHIEIKIIKEDDMVHYVVSDNGVGRNSAKKDLSQTERTSMGLKITENRIKIMNETSKTHGSVHISDKEQGVQVDIRIPLRYAS